MFYETLCLVLIFKGEPYEIEFHRPRVGRVKINFVPGLASGFANLVRNVCVRPLSELIYI